MNTAKVIAALRVMLLVLMMAFIVLTAYKYFVKGTLEWMTVMPVAGLLVFYLIVRPKTVET
ncbi:MAG: hypothetical protein ACJ73D_04210 [Pyrinomonadaceae bacterium]